MVFEMRNGWIINAPIKQESELKLGCYRPFNPHHRIDPLTDARILLKRPGVDQIHATGPYNTAINHKDLTVQAQVSTAELKAPQLNR